MIGSCKMIEKIQTIVKPIIEDFGAELVEIVVKGSKRNKILVLYVDRPGGITINECTRISRDILKVEDLDALLGNNYRLEVSSPGMDRPLKTVRDFQRNVGHFLEVQFEDEKGLHKIRGDLKSVNNETIFLQNKQGEHKIALESILKAKQEIKW